ncbi:YqeG family HAD IIIA-type phosphatase [Acetivibrio mesophilus]|uniref:YqeG family HAD IIIA-type phosphatase n=1 Tax=Acetivibrio mesophilus TaxID=2487273 RepID=A0A4Q0I5Q9_9FIRM|nr:YqeG family HAD IIIA-type phosphatase [Acetivibrio mesophilus]ODM25287.1 HAD family hydrolase [Clostridium sp. Bc-iso-3]RXE59693.1 YqeG family HAD IIIA-type phosphatase [Acetivibrio mesophilus]HHV28585.1 YqeG family HAD IIIA-type phosphatase [Clostridium sp.]
MLEKFYPNLQAHRVHDIDLDFLIKNNIKGLILDIDNTLVPDHVEEADENTIAWINKVKKMGFKVCIVSNASEKRVVKFNNKLKVDIIHRASKPNSKSFLKAMEIMNTKASETAVIGDQIFTDIYGGNKVNMFTILVSPIDKREYFFVRLKRIPEKFVLAKMKNKRQT